MPPHFYTFQLNSTQLYISISIPLKEEQEKPMRIAAADSYGLFLWPHLLFSLLLRAHSHILPALPPPPLPPPPVLLSFALPSFLPSLPTQEFDL